MFIVLFSNMQVGKFIVGQPEGSDKIIGEESVPKGQRFPEILKGKGVRGHRYHVFDKPRYGFFVFFCFMFFFRKK